MPHDIRPTPEEFDAARATVTDALDHAGEAFPLEREIDVELRWDGSAFVTEQVDGAAGFADYPATIELRFDTSPDGWRDSLASSAVHEHAHCWFFDRRGRESDRKWEYVLEEAFTQTVAESLVPKYESPWWTRHDDATLAEWWPTVRDEEFDAPSEDAGPVFIDPGDGGYPHGLGYSLSYRLGTELRAEREFDEFVGVSRDELVSVGDRLFVE